jgi:large subunit ribosomal protein L29
MKLAELKKLDEKSLKSQIIETRKAMMALRFQKVAGELTDTSGLSKNKKTIARIKTLLSQKQRQA